MKKKTLYSLFIIILLTSEFLYIEIGGGVARIYHFLAPLVILSFAGYIPQLFRSRVFIALLGFFFINLIAALAADTPEKSLSSVLSLGANITVAISVALILISNKVDIESLKKLILTVTVIAVLWGIIQVFTFKFAGLNLGLSEPQTGQILAGFAPAFRSEANTFAKYLNFVFLLFLPMLLKGKNNRQVMSIFVILVVGMLMSFTRSALYGLTVTLVVTYFWYLLKGKGRLISPKVVASSALVIIAFFVFASFVGDFNEYTAHKIETFVDKTEILEGGSSGFRLMSQGFMIDAFLTNIKTILIGNGWGQVFFDYGGTVWQAGGGDLILILAYGGILAGIMYVAYVFYSIAALNKLASLHRQGVRASTYEGVMFAIIGSFITGQINGALIAPEYWLMFGVAMFVDYERQNISRIKCGQYARI